MCNSSTERLEICASPKNMLQAEEALSPVRADIVLDCHSLPLPLSLISKHCFALFGLVPCFWIYCLFSTLIQKACCEALGNEGGAAE